MSRAETLLVIGPLPPPLNGMTVMTAYATEALRESGRNFVHVDTSDHRPVGNVGSLDWINIALAFRHSYKLLASTAGRGPYILYMPVAQGVLGFVRDALFFEIARARRVPVVVHLHGAAFGDFYCRSPQPIQWLIRRCLRRARRAIVLGEGLTQVFGELVRREDLAVVPNGIPEPLLRTERVARSSVRVLYLSNLSPGKGYLDVLEAAVELTRRHENVEFTIAGEWGDSRESRSAHEYIRRHGGHHQIRFVPTPSGLRKNQLFDSADIFVFPPRQIEGQPVVLLEAMSHGLPIVTTPQGGIPDIVYEGTNGLLVPAGSSQRLAAALERLISDSSLRMRLGTKGRELYLARHTMKAFSSQLDAAIGLGALVGTA